jgi:hypothetical protein
VRFNDVWLFDWDTKDWSAVSVQGDGPAARAHFRCGRLGAPAAWVCSLDACSAGLHHSLRTA